MLKLIATFLTAAALGGCTPPTTQSGPANPAPSQVSSCSIGLQRCTGVHDAGANQCYDPFKSSCHSGKVCSLGQRLCEKDGLSYCFDPKNRKC